MTKYKLEYIWLDGKKPVPGLRGKTKMESFEKAPTLGDLPNWGFDGSSTMQAEGKSSDCILKPVALASIAFTALAGFLHWIIVGPDEVQPEDEARARTVLQETGDPK